MKVKDKQLAPDRALDDEVVNASLEVACEAIGSRLDLLNLRPDEERDEGVEREEKLLKIALFIIVHMDISNITLTHNLDA